MLTEAQAFLPHCRRPLRSGDRPRTLDLHGIGRAAYPHLCTHVQSRSQASTTTSFCYLNWRGNMQRGLSNHMVRRGRPTMIVQAMPAKAWWVALTLACFTMFAH